MNLRFPLFFALCAVALTGPANAEVEPFFKEHCLRCHGEEKQKGDFRIDELSRDFSSGKDAELWFEVITRMGAGEMPPDDEPNLPTAAESDRVMEWLTQQIKEGEAARAAARPSVAHCTPSNPAGPAPR
ncbi:MAG: c-type cytochrome domain-containing protein [Rubripirellula sp.]